jgi:hypothetical protein
MPLEVPPWGPCRQVAEHARRGILDKLRVPRSGKPGSAAVTLESSGIDQRVLKIGGKAYVRSDDGFVPVCTVVPRRERRVTSVCEFLAVQDYEVPGDSPGPPRQGVAHLPALNPANASRSVTTWPVPVAT